MEWMKKSRSFLVLFLGYPLDCSHRFFRTLPTVDRTFDEQAFRL